MDVFFTINGKPYQINANTVAVDTSLNTFIRTKAQLSGTKFMCSEGGCGACIVSVKGIHPVTKEEKVWAVNSCLTSVFSCHGLEITTVEGVGNRQTGYHTIQKRLAHLNGTQCGYCSPGMVMNMYSLLQSKNGKVSMEEVENSFGGNICRCTGYRPILDAFKSFAYDADKALIEACMDIEDLTKTCPKTGSPCAGLCHKAKGPLSMVFDDGRRWHKASNIAEIFNVLENAGNEPYMFVAGNTAHGVYRRNENLKYFIDITGVEALRSHAINGSELVLGANVSLTETMEILTKASSQVGFEYCKHLVDHIDLIANVPVRNAGTIAGNLSIKHGNVEFPSDMFIILEAAGAKMTIASGLSTCRIKPKTKVVSVAEYVHLDMTKKLILNVILPKLDPTTYSFRSYKVMPRAQNSHAYVNAGFLFEFKNGLVNNARICFGGIAPEFVHASKTEKLLVGKKLYENDVLQSALRSLTTEMSPDWVLPDASPEYRKNLAAALFYKFVLNTCPTDLVGKKYVLGGSIVDRAISSGTQSFDTFKERYPLTEKVPKYEGLIQCSGELQYINDIKPMDGELWAAFVQATEIHSFVESIDASDALSLPGVEFFFSASDIPGENNFMPAAVVAVFGSGNVEQIFLSKENPVLYNGQPVGVILASTFALANRAAKKVKLTYKKPEVKQPIITSLHDAHYKKATERYHPIPYLKIAPTVVTDLSDKNPKKVAGTFDIGTQYHYTMEPQTCVCIPAEDGIEVISSTQWVHKVQIAVSRCLNIPNNQVNMGLRRLGGAYGCKGTRATHVACAAAIACKHTNRPVRFVMTLEANMEVMGKRFPLLNEYDVDVDDDGRILKMVNNFAQDFGSNMNDGPVFNTINHVKNVYVPDTWDVQCSATLTDAPSNTYCRAPGTTEGLAMIENIMEHIARVTGKDTLSVRMANMPENHKMRTMLPDFLKSIDFDERKQKIEEFNRNNRWRKRGIAFVPMEYPQPYFGMYPAIVAIYPEDGTVAVAHGGVECGQGINTKVAQVVAHCLNIPLSYVSVKRMDNVVGANSFCTGGSMTSEALCMAVKKACETLLERMKPVRDELGDPKWNVLTQACYDKLVDLSCKSIFDKNEVTEYTIWGCSCAEVEVDILTGNLKLTRVDILEDTGESMSPGIDVGQVEGAFVMGIGYWLTESVVYGTEKGELLTNRTWTYKPPGAKDIPVDFRVTFLHNSSNAAGVLRSKATGEPPLCMSIVVIFALRHALESARKDAGITDWFEMGAPSTPDRLFLSAGNSLEHFKLY
ncbi:xanthine dehydrogenase-like [Bradysia coprophila]|uniref:xanthine dehydrogenase-like n=1 Tax=Bradysia coprophila TaxID=38358 RepID=UPI00187DDA32|nr:xanthine dehydrogenase-like [Bradysia coprophila]